MTKKSLVVLVAVAVVVFLPSLGLAGAVQEVTTETRGMGDVLKAAGIFGVIIGLVSVIAMALIIEHMVNVKRDKLAPPDLIDEVEALFDEENFQEAVEVCEAEPGYFTNIVAAGIGKIGHPFETIEMSVAEMGAEEAVKLHQKIGWLSLIANIAPMLGLMGTVSGMIGSFNVIASKGGQTNPADFADEISQALVTTLLGLIVAIPASAMFVFFRNRVVMTALEVGAITEDLFERFRPTSAG